MSATKDGGPAFPDKKRIYSAGYATSEYEPVPGMSLRDYFAAKALAALIAEPVEGIKEAVVHELSDSTVELFAGAAYKFAAAMLKARQA